MNEQQRAVVQQLMDAARVAGITVQCAVVQQQVSAALAAGKALLEQSEPVQEPVLWMGPTKIADLCDADDFVRNFSYEQGGVFQTPLYTTPPAQPAACTWSQVDDEHTPDTWEADCGAMWTFTDGGPADNDMKFCPKCGKHVEQEGSK
jgi:hypothetical protein